MTAKLHFIALVPPEPLRGQVRALKEEIRERFGAGHALKSPAHITLQMPFRLAPEAAPVLHQTLEEVAARQYAFQVDLDGFDCFPPRVLFLRVVDHRPIVRLHRELKGALEQTGIPGLEAGPSRFHPHMTLATRDLTEEAFYRAWQEFETRVFRAAFTAGGLHLLKHTGRRWEVSAEYPITTRLS